MTTRGPLVVVAGLGGGLWALCFARHPHTLLAWVALVPLVLLLGKVRAGRLAWVHGMVYWLVALAWIRPTIETYGGLDRTTAVVGLLALAAYLAAYHAVFAWLGAPLWRRGSRLALLGLPALWVALEWVRTWLFSGFPWNLAAYAWTDLPGALPLSAWIGAYGVSFLLVLANVAAARALLRRSLATLAVGWAVPLLLLAVGGRWGSGTAPPSGLALPVRILQPNIENLTSYDAAVIEAGYRRLLQMSDAACDEPGALLVWPESAAWPLSLERDARLRDDVEGLTRRGCSVLLNSDHETAAGYYNSAYLVDLGGPHAAQRYDKRHLVPFGEYVPLKRLLPFLDKLARSAGNFLAADQVRLLRVGDERLGPAVCFEVVFPAEVAEEVRAGATVLVTITNDAWYGPTAAPWQHFRAARFRAAESRRPLLRAAITGVSALVGSDGRVLAELGPGEQGILRGAVRGRGDLSPYSRAPLLLPLLCLAGAAFAILRR